MVHETGAARGKDEGDEKELGGLRFAIIEDISQKAGSVYSPPSFCRSAPKSPLPAAGGRGARGNTLRRREGYPDLEKRPKKWGIGIMSPIFSDFLPPIFVLY